MRMPHMPRMPHACAEPATCLLARPQYNIEPQEKAKRWCAAVARGMSRAAPHDAAVAGRWRRSPSSTRCTRRWRPRACTCAACTTSTATPPLRRRRCVPQARVAPAVADVLHACAAAADVDARRARLQARSSGACLQLIPLLTCSPARRGDHVPPEVGSGFCTGYSYEAPVVRAAARGNAATRVSNNNVPFARHRSACSATWRGSSGAAP
jgi:hypothetical protein